MTLPVWAWVFLGAIGGWSIVLLIIIAVGLWRARHDRLPADR